MYHFEYCFYLCLQSASNFTENLKGGDSHRNALNAFASFSSLTNEISSLERASYRCKKYTCPTRWLQNKWTCCNIFVFQPSKTVLTGYTTIHFIPLRLNFVCISYFVPIKRHLSPYAVKSGSFSPQNPQLALATHYSM